MKPQSIEALGGIQLPSAGEILGELAHDAFDSVIADFKRPEFRAGFAVAITSAIVLARLGVRGFPAVLASVMLGTAAERFVATTEEIAEHIAHIEINGMATDAADPV